MRDRPSSDSEALSAEPAKSFKKDAVVSVSSSSLSLTHDEPIFEIS